MVIFPVISLHSCILPIGMSFILLHLFYWLQVSSSPFSHALGAFLILNRKLIRLSLSLLRQLSRHLPSVAQGIFLSANPLSTQHTMGGVDT